MSKNKKPERRGRPIAPTRKPSAVTPSMREWWHGVVTHPAFFSVLEEAKRAVHGRHQGIQEQAHGQLYAGGFHAGADEIAAELVALATATESAPTPNHGYMPDPDIHTP